MTYTFPVAIVGLGSLAVGARQCGVPDELLEPTAEDVEFYVGLLGGPKACPDTARAAAGAAHGVMLETIAEALAAGLLGNAAAAIQRARALDVALSRVTGQPTVREQHCGPVGRVEALPTAPPATREAVAA